MLYLSELRMKCILGYSMQIIVGLVVLTVTSATTQSDRIPLVCDPIICPADADMQCPEDSSIREMREMNAVDLMSSNAIVSTTTKSPALGGDGDESNAYNRSLVPDELFAQCCLTKKCVCNTCYISDCNSDEGEVVVELRPEDMNTPGQCCGVHECRKEPNCTEVWDSEYYWLQSCQRCSCNSGAAICQQSCDEGTNAICESKNLNTFFNDGDTWKDGCLQCECVNGEEKCMIPLCRHVNCPAERQVNLKDTCCPVCWPKGEPMPHETPSNYDNGYGYGHQLETKIETKTARKTETDSNTSTDNDTDTEVPLGGGSSTTTTTNPPTTTSSSSSSTTTTERVETNAKLNIYSGTDASAPTPCQTHDFPKVVEVVHQPNYFIEHLYPILIGILIIIIFGLSIYIRHLLAKQRSYRPVFFDDKAYAIERESLRV